MRTSIKRTRIAAAAIAVSLAAAGAVGLAASSEAAAATYAVSPKTGPGGDGSGTQPTAPAKVVTINGTGTAFKTAGGTVKVGAVTWQPSGTVCAVATNAFLGTAWTVPTASQIVLTVPAGTFALTGTTTFTKKDYTLCVYDTATPKVLMGSGKYSVYPAPTISAAVSPVKGPASGGNTIAIDGTNFTVASVVKIGGVAATGVKVATDGKSLTAKVPAGTASTTAVQVTVTTEGGTNAPTSGGGAAWDDYTYVSAVSVSPSTGVGATDTITVNGRGFDAIDFTLAKVKVYLIQGGFVLASAGTYEICGSIQVVSDTRLVCQTDGTVADGAYTVTLVTDNTVVTSAATVSAISASATYTAADF